MVNVQEELQKILVYFTKVPYGTARLNQKDLHKFWGCTRKDVPEHLKFFAKRHGLKAEPEGDGMWKFTRDHLL